MADGKELSLFREGSLAVRELRFKTEVCSSIPKASRGELPAEKAWLMSKYL